MVKLQGPQNRQMVELLWVNFAPKKLSLKIFAAPQPPPRISSFRTTLYVKFEQIKQVFSKFRKFFTKLPIFREKLNFDPKYTEKLQFYCIFVPFFDKRQHWLKGKISNSTRLQNSAFPTHVQSNSKTYRILYVPKNFIPVLQTRVGNLIYFWANQFLKISLDEILEVIVI